MSNLLIDYLIFRSKLEPEAIAIKAYDEEITFRQLYILTKKIANKLQEIGVRVGQHISTSIHDRKLDWLITLALFHEGAITCSTHLDFSLNLGFEFAWHITDNPSNPLHSSIITINSDWINQAIRGSAECEVKQYECDSSVIRLVLTSGTEGIRKAVGLSYPMLLGRFNQRNVAFSKLGQEVTMLPMGSISGDNSAFHSLFSGMPFVCLERLQDICDYINSHSIGFLSGSPNQLLALVKFIRSHKIDLKKVKAVASGGGLTSTYLYQNIIELLGDKFINYYGSSEAGGCTMMISSTQNLQSLMPGYAFPNVEIEIVNDAHEPLAPNAMGSIRIKTPYMTHEYYCNPQATARSFKNGWFYPGDQGYLMQDGQLILVGRSSELINRGGVKIDPASIDHALLECEGVEDAAVFSLENHGILDMAAAIVATEKFDIKTLQQECLNKLGVHRTPFAFYKVDRILRNHMGKVMRSQISQRVVKFIEHNKK